ncbi:MAG: VanZ family protein [Isosphaeraceae bacterium]
MRRSAVLALLIVYLLVLLNLTLVQFPQPGASANLIPFATIARDVQAGGWGLRMNVGGNLVAFLPLGILLVWLQRGRATPFGVALASVGLSLTIESLQYLSGQRVADIDDVLLNTLSGVLGFALAVGLDRLRAGSAVRRGRQDGSSHSENCRTRTLATVSQARPIRAAAPSSGVLLVDDFQTMAAPGRNHY